MIPKIYTNVSRLITLTLGITIILSSCNAEKVNENVTHAYFGGEIVNPNSNYLILSKNRSHHDTIFLDKNNRFLHRIDDLEEGIYAFKHNPENQILLLEKGDSILIRLNTLEFDESLVFTGRGARKNNFLIDMFLQNEKERKQLERTKFKTPPADFVSKQDSLFKNRAKIYDQFNDKYKLSDLAQKITKSSFLYDFYSRYEMYFYWHYGMSRRDPFKDVPKTFFDYRHKANMNDHDLKRLYAYNRFLNHHIINVTYSNYIKSKTYPKSQAELTVNELEVIDSLINHSYIKNSLLRGFTAKFLLESETTFGSEKVLNAYLKKSTNSKFKKELKKLARSTSRLKPNKIIPDQDLISSNGETVQLSSLFKKPVTALYFWSIESKIHFVRAHKKASYLREHYPEIDVIAINTDEEQTKNWLNTINRYQYDNVNEYEFKYPKCSSEELVIHYRNKVILINQDGRIINANADLFSSYFESQLINYSRVASLRK